MTLPFFNGGVRFYVLTYAATAVFMLCSAASAQSSIDSRFDSIIESVSSENNIDPMLVKAIIWHESRFKPLAKGAAGEIGLMQIKMCAAKDWAKHTGNRLPSRAELHDPYMNISIGVWYFSKAVKSWKESLYALPLALAEYNMGRARLKRWLDRNNGNEKNTITTCGVVGYVDSVRNKYIEYSSTFKIADSR